MIDRADFFSIKNGSKAKLPFSDSEYKNRQEKLKKLMSKNNLDLIILTSMHNIAYYTGFIYCSFGRPYGCIVTEKKIVTISANIDAGQPWRRSVCDNIIYTDWKRDNFLKAIKAANGKSNTPKNIGIENDHVTLEMKDKFASLFVSSKMTDVSKDLMKLRMIKSNEELKIIRNGARIADIGGKEIIKNLKVGASELEIAIAGRDKMELEIAKIYGYLGLAPIRNKYRWSTQSKNFKKTNIRRHYIFKYISNDIWLLYSSRKNFVFTSSRRCFFKSMGSKYKSS